MSDPVRDLMDHSHSDAVYKYETPSPQTLKAEAAVRALLAERDRLARECNVHALNCAHLRAELSAARAGCFRLTLTLVLLVTMLASALTTLSGSQLCEPLSTPLEPLPAQEGSRREYW